jgi:tetratricopeptide (TPR) repeat protein
LSSVPDAERSAKALFSAGIHLRAAEAIQASHRGVSQGDRTRSRQPGCDSRPWPKACWNDGQVDAALEQYKVIADANPEDAQTYVRMAEIYRQQGKFDLALENLKKAGSMVQDSIEVPYNMAPRFTRPRAATTRHPRSLTESAEENRKERRQLLARARRIIGRYFWSGWARHLRDEDNYQDSAAIDTFRQDAGAWRIRQCRARLPAGH